MLSRVVEGSWHDVKHDSPRWNHPYPGAPRAGVAHGVSDLVSLVAMTLGGAEFQLRHQALGANRALASEEMPFLLFSPHFFPSGSNNQISSDMCCAFVVTIHFPSFDTSNG